MPISTPTSVALLLALLCAPVASATPQTSTNETPAQLDLDAAFSQPIRTLAARPAIRARKKGQPAQVRTGLVVTGVGVVAGGVGLPLMIGGAVTEQEALTYTGLGLVGVGLPTIAAGSLVSAYGYRRPASPVAGWAGLGLFVAMDGVILHSFTVSDILGHVILGVGAAGGGLLATRIQMAINAQAGRRKKGRTGSWMVLPGALPQGADLRLATTW